MKNRTKPPSHVMSTLVAAATIASLATLTGCGGGSAGTPTNDPPVVVDPTPGDDDLSPTNDDTAHDDDDGQPTLQPDAATSHTRETANELAADPRDHWHEPAALASALALEPIDPSDEAGELTTVRAALANADPAIVETWNQALEAGRVDILGSRDGYLITKGGGGPAGHIKFVFDYTHAPDTSQEIRTLLERAGKAWARRIKDPLAGPPPDTGPRAVTYLYGRHGRVELLPNAVLVQVERRDTENSSAGVGFVPGEEGVTSLATPRHGVINLGNDMRDPANRGRYARILSHELGHVLGFAPDYWGPLWKALIDEDRHIWIGAKATEYHGGEVPMQWYSGQWGPAYPVPAGTPGAKRDPSHIGPCESILSYCAA